MPKVSELRDSRCTEKHRYYYIYISYLLFLVFSLLSLYKLHKSHSEIHSVQFYNDLKWRLRVIFFTWFSNMESTPYTMTMRKLSDVAELNSMFKIVCYKVSS